MNKILLLIFSLNVASFVYASDNNNTGFFYDHHCGPATRVPGEQIRPADKAYALGLELGRAAVLDRLLDLCFDAADLEWQIKNGGGNQLGHQLREINERLEVVVKEYHDIK